MSIVNEPDYAKDYLFNDNFAVNTDPKQDIDITAADEWTPDQVDDYVNRKKKKNMREIIMYIRRQVWLKVRAEIAEKEAEEKAESAKKARIVKLYMQVALAAAGVVGVAFGTIFVARILGV